MPILTLRPEDRIQMKKTHPCGENRMRVARVGSDIRIICEGCQRDMTLPSEKLEKAIRKIENNSDG